MWLTRFSLSLSCLLHAPCVLHAQTEPAPPAVPVPGIEVPIGLEYRGDGSEGPYFDEEIALVGKPVGRVRLETIREEGATDCPFRLRIRYDREGRRREIERYDIFHEFDYRKELRFDEATGAFLGEVEWRSRAPRAEPHTETFPTYDDEGRVRSVEIRYDDGWTSTYQYDSSGRAVERSGHFDGSVTRYEYDDAAGTLTERVRTEDGAEYVQQVSRYKDGELLSSSLFSPDGSLIRSIIQKRLPEGVVVRLEYFAPTGWLDTWIEARDGERLRHWRHVWLRRTLDERTLYTYDERGNWIRREKQLRLPDGSWFDDGFAIVREIEYYD